MRIIVVGSGYVGLVTGVCFAESGVNVTCIDNNPDKIQKLKKGIVPIYEPGLEDMLKRNVEKKRLTFTTELKDGIDGAEVIFVAVLSRKNLTKRARPSVPRRISRKSPMDN